VLRFVCVVFNHRAALACHFQQW